MVKKLSLYVFLVLMLFLNSASATCDDKPGDGVDYSNCQFADGQDLNGTYIPNANFEGANLNNAVWSDGKKCFLGSIGECKTE